MNTIGHFINGELSTNHARSQAVLIQSTGEQSKEVAIASVETV
jgi:malonate-semialdehyde dehydrogenase (acetylating)/methylmalonate-semialdehyde dehydrogenase